MFEILNQANVTSPVNSHSNVVDFDQWKGASHTNGWSKHLFRQFKHIFPSQREKTRRKVQRGEKYIKKGFARVYILLPNGIHPKAGQLLGKKVDGFNDKCILRSSRSNSGSNMQSCQRFIPASFICSHVKQLGMERKKRFLLWYPISNYILQDPWFWVSNIQILTVNGMVMSYHASNTNTNTNTKLMQQDRQRIAISSDNLE